MSKQFLVLNICRILLKNYFNTIRYYVFTTINTKMHKLRKKKKCPFDGYLRYIPYVYCIDSKMRFPHGYFKFFIVLPTARITEYIKYIDVRFKMNAFVFYNNYPSIFRLNGTLRFVWKKIDL